jgi:hypothetical protein
MKLTYRRSGGVAGMIKRAVIETEHLPADERAAWEQLVAAADVFALPATVPAADPRQRDAFTHSLLIEDGPRRHAVEVEGAPAAAPLRALLDRLQGASTRAPD